MGAGTLPKNGDICTYKKTELHTSWPRYKRTEVLTKPALSIGCQLLLVCTFQLWVSCNSEQTNNSLPVIENSKLVQKLFRKSLEYHIWDCYRGLENNAGGGQWRERKGRRCKGSAHIAEYFYLNEQAVCPKCPVKDYLFRKHPITWNGCHFVH